MTASRQLQGTPFLVDLDDDSALDPCLVGAKAAGLARARRAGLPALPGVVVPVGAGGPVLANAVAALRSGGSGAARLDVMQALVPEALVVAMAEAISDLAPPAIVRSSSPLESGGAWAGAFSSLDGIGPDDARTALRSVWASAFTVHALERCELTGLDPEDIRLAVLVQPELQPLAGGSARVLPDGTVAVVAVSGSPRNLLAGWDAGYRARVARGGSVCGEDAVRAVGQAPLLAAAQLAVDVAAAAGDLLVEWAWADGKIVLLQSATGAAQVPDRTAAPVAGLDDPLAMRIAHLAVRCPGPLGESLVLGWASGVERLPTVHASPSADPARDLAVATAEAQELLKFAWDERLERAVMDSRHTLASLRGQNPAAALVRLARLRPVDPDRGARVIQRLEGAATALARAGTLVDERRLWRCVPDEAVAIAAGKKTPPAQPRVGPDRWEPYVHAVTATQGRHVRGLPAGAGVAAGRVRVVQDPHEPPSLADRDVVVVDRPLPALAPLLWTAGALVTVAGSAAAHLLEVAHSLGVPAIVGADVETAVPGGLSTLASGEWVAAVDGDQGTVALSLA